MISIVMILGLLLVLNILPNAYETIAFAGIVVALLYRYENMYNKAWIYYTVFFVIGIVTFIFYRSPILDLFVQGIIGYGFFLVVMFVGVLPNKWGITRVIKKNRGVLSILGFISITPHALLRVLGIYSYVDLFGIAAFVIMVPLTIISFRVIRKEINPKDWFTIQKGAYAIYLLLFTHLLVVSSWQNKIVYAVLLTLYVNNKLIKEIKKRL